MKPVFFVLLFVLCMTACKNEPEEQTNFKNGNKEKPKEQRKQLKPSDERAVEIMDSVIAKAGGKRYQTAEIEFNFRDTTYVSKRDCGQFQLQRKFKNRQGEQVVDEVNNIGFERRINGEKVDLTQKKAKVLKNNINAVHYFMQLPFGLNDPAVHKYYLGSSKINDQPYQKIKVLFQKQSGGKDHQDEYRYWVNDSTQFVDYMAYSYETGDGSMRFREAFNPRTVEGIRFVDYYNYAPKSDSLNIKDLEKAFQEGKLKRVSVIENNAVQVELSKKTCD